MTSLDFKSRKHTFLTELSTLRANAKREAERKRPSAQEQDENTPDATDNQNSQKQWFSNYGVVTTRYLEQVHSINTIKGLSRKLNIANACHDSVEKSLNLSFRTIDAIVKACEKWRDYLADQESFDLLVCLEVISMAKIHASVIAARNFSERQGISGVRLKSDASIPYLFTTVVSYYGSLQIFS